ncbi:MAG TPA: PepSY domain-containing protein, partial [Nevskiaceae bacterium]|nr:PepSY domain-containing protein [Nevskiaceae bacterium]
MLRNVLFQVHWFLGITAGLVLCVMGVTGATLSFEDELVRGLNPGVTSVPVRAEAPLSPPELLERVEHAQPERRVGTISVSSIPGRSVKVGFLQQQAPPPSKDGKPPRIRMDIEYADPYDGRLLGAED